jgi:hypothetical protein
MKRVVTFLLLFSLTTACLDPQEFSEEELQALVDTELEKRLLNYQQIKLERCRENLLIKANSIVDSLLYLEAQQMADSLSNTNVLPKPARPEIRIVRDTRPIAPLFDTIIDSIRIDSIKRKKS